MARQAVINCLPGPYLFSKGSLNQNQVKVSLVLKAIQKVWRLLQCVPDFLLGHTIGSGPFDDNVPVDASIAKSSGHAPGDTLAAAESLAGGGDRRLGIPSIAGSG